MKKNKLIVVIMIVVLVMFTYSTAFADGILKKGARGDEVIKLQSFLLDLGYFDEVTTGYFGVVTEGAVIGFQSDYELEADGIVGPNTLKALKDVGYDDSTFIENTSIASTDGVQMLNWWSDAQYIFGLNTIAKVTDVWTGKQYDIIRTYGHNHADCEALTFKDSNIMKDVWGGAWSWSRRPSIVEVDGQKIAASIAAMPHAGVDSAPANKTVSNRSGGYSRGTNMDKIKSNNMSGVFDVHFLNSRTHNTNRKDKKHQAMVKVAADK